MAESVYQSRLIKRIKKLFPGCIVILNDSGYIQGIPDILVLYKKTWVMLEAKDYEGAPERPNQSYYINLFNNMSYGSFIFPENDHRIITEMQSHFDKYGDPYEIK